MQPDMIQMMRTQVRAIHVALTGSDVPEEEPTPAPSVEESSTTTPPPEEVMQRFVELTTRTVPNDERLPETIEETLVGGVAWIVYQQIRRDETDKAKDLLPELSEFMLAPFQRASRSKSA